MFHLLFIGFHRHPTAGFEMLSVKQVPMYFPVVLQFPYTYPTMHLLLIVVTVK